MDTEIMKTLQLLEDITKTFKNMENHKGFKRWLAEVRKNCPRVAWFYGPLVYIVRNNAYNTVMAMCDYLEGLTPEASADLLNDQYLTHKKFLDDETGAAL